VVEVDNIVLENKTALEVATQLYNNRKHQTLILPFIMISVQDYLDILCFDSSLKDIPNSDKSIELLLPLSKKLIEQATGH
jgi:hypothetical protein